MQSHPEQPEGSGGNNDKVGGVTFADSPIYLLKPMLKKNVVTNRKII
jgi:hypothetical protein